MRRSVRRTKHERTGYPIHGGCGGFHHHRRDPGGDPHQHTGSAHRYSPNPQPPPPDTPVPSPTLEAAALVPTFTSVPTTLSDPCNQPLGSVQGHPTKIKLVNQTKGSLVVSLYLNLTPFGECGYRGYNLEKNDTLVITDLVTGCYNVSVFVTEPNRSSKAFGYGCINNPDTWTFEISADNVKFVGP